VWRFSFVAFWGYPVRVFFCNMSRHYLQNSRVVFRSSSSSSGGASLAGHERLHEFSPLGTVLRTLPRRVKAEIVLLEVELNCSKPGSSWSARWATPVHRQTRRLMAARRAREWSWNGPARAMCSDTVCEPLKRHTNWQYGIEMEAALGVNGAVCSELVVAGLWSAFDRNQCGRRMIAVGRHPVPEIITSPRKTSMDDVSIARPCEREAAYFCALRHPWNWFTTFVPNKLMLFIIQLAQICVPLSYMNSNTVDAH